jgi:organic hydroperoxide reductase OsmC/OhrA
MLSAGTDVKGSAGYVAIERVSGALRGRSGSFVLQHHATMTRGTPHQNIVVIPDSGTGELAGLTGHMRIIIAGGKHSYEFEYSLPDDQLTPKLREHHYRTLVRWTGNIGTGTSGYRAYRRDHVIEADGKPSIPASSDPHFRGDRTRWNPEDLLVASLSACHQLWYLHLCSDAGVVVTAYEDRAEGLMLEGSDGSGRFTRVLLRPTVRIRSGSDADLAASLHEKAHAMCFIARSVNFPVECESSVSIDAPG